MTKRSSFKNWFYRNWQLMKLSDADHISIRWNEFQDALEEAYNAGVNAEVRRRNCDLKASFKKDTEATEERRYSLDITSESTW